MRRLSIGYSPCPNDTFIFYALIHGLINTGELSFSEVLLDVDELNRDALRGKLDISKVSFHAYAHLKGQYELLRCGGAIGRGCGPLVVAKEQCAMSDLKGKTIAVPGLLTTAYLLLLLYDPSFKNNVKAMRFDEIMPAVVRGEVDAGLIIHESRFTYPLYELKEIIDLGKWWEAVTGLPIPLGGIIAKRSLGNELLEQIQSLIKESVLYAIRNPYEPMNYIKRHSQEMSEEVVRKHIKLYVNDYSVDMGPEGMEAVRVLLKKIENQNTIKPYG